jgi:membrane protein DedA with SNARE-associated domain
VANLVAWLEHIGVAAVFVFVLVEQGGLPLPAYPLFIIAGAWSARGGAPIAWITGVAVGACLIADLAWYAAGRRLGSRVLRAVCKLSLEPDSSVSGTERVFMRFGTRVLLLAKFVPGLGEVASAMSGVVGPSIMGFHPVRPLAGRVHAWLDAGFAVERSKSRGSGCHWRGIHRAS